MILTNECYECGSKFTLEYDTDEGNALPFYCPLCGEDMEYSSDEDELEFKDTINSALDFDS